MAELRDIYDENRNETGRIAQRVITKLEIGKEYHIIGQGIINSNNEILIGSKI